ncbi:MAG TPA: protein kinase [Terriglobales bacterium]|nr:protein kinase [Terriglobales bacterium]
MSLGPYELLASIGAGGMGEVYRARDPRLGRDVAIKILPPQFSADSERLRRFEQEARAAAALNHPGILAIYDLGTQSNGSPYIVSELLEGESLRERLRSGPLPLRKAVEYGAQIALGLAAAHEKGIVHRDLKPENLFLTKDGRAKILDFGLAKLTERGSDAETVVHSEGTSPGMVLGTVGYMSPEQVRGIATDYRSDIFTLGAILYEMLSGKRAFHGDTTADTMSAILKEEPPELTETNRQVPPALERIVRHCLEKNPDERFQSARDVAFDLGALSSPSTSAIVAVSAGAVSSRAGRRARFALAGTIGLIAALGLGMAIGARWSRPQPPHYQQLTFRRGSIEGARFAPDGHTIVYSAAWEGGQPELYSSRDDGQGERPLGITGAKLLAISSTGEMALLTKIQPPRNWIDTGTLARAPLAGGAPRELLEGVGSADWSPDGKELAVSRFEAGSAQWKLEYPVGKVIYQSPGWISHIRVSPRGDRIAFLEHPPTGDDRGHVAVVSLSGAKKDLSAELASVQGVAWSRDGGEIWFTASTNGNNRMLYAVTPAGRQRLVDTVPGKLQLEDMGADGRALLQLQSAGRAMVGVRAGQSREISLGWLDYPFPRDLTPDGKTVLFEEEGEGGGPRYTVFVRATDGSPAVAIGEGYASAISPDGKWALTLSPDDAHRATIVPVGAGESRNLPVSDISYGMGRWLLDSRHYIFAGQQGNHPARTFVVDRMTGQIQPLTPEGTAGIFPSPDGVWLPVRDSNNRDWLWPLKGGEKRPLNGVEPQQFVIGWHDNKSLLLTSNKPEDRIPRRVYMLDIATGRQQFWKALGPSDTAGMRSVGPIALAGDNYVYGYTRQLSDLFLTSGLR